MGDGDDKSALTGNEPLLGSDIGGETTFFPLRALSSIAWVSHLLGNLGNLHVGLVLGKFVVFCVYWGEWAIMGSREKSPSEDDRGKGGLY